MIPITNQAKEAFREGNTLKRYRFLVEGKEGDITFETFKDFEEDPEVEGKSKNLVFYDQPAGSYEVYSYQQETGHLYRAAVRVEGQVDQYVYPVSEGGKDVIKFTSFNPIIFIRVERERQTVFTDLMCFLKRAPWPIDNDHLISESVKFDERLCSDDVLTYGLCEGTSLEFQYFGLPNVRGQKLHCFLDVQINDGTWYNDIPMGYFTVTEVSRQASTGIMKVSAYNNLGLDAVNSGDSLLTAGKYTVDPETSSISVYDLLGDLIDEGILNIADDKTVVIPFTTTDTVTEFPSSAMQEREDDSALNRHRYPTGTTFYLHGKYVKYKALSPSYPWDIEAVKGSLDGLERSFVEVLLRAEGAWESYERLDLDPYTKSWIVYYMIHTSTYGFVNYFGLTYWNDSHGDDDFFSTITTMYNATTTDPVAIDGNFADCSWLRGQKMPNNAYAPMTVAVHLPIYISDSPNAGEGTITPLIYDPENRYYEYEDDGVIKTAEFPYWKYSNGDPVLEQPINVYYHTKLPSGMLKQIKIGEIPDYTPRDVLSASYEMNCQFGKIDRTTDLFSGVELAYQGLYPAETLVPSTSLLPNWYTGATSASASTAPENVNPAMYSKLWADEGNIRKFKTLTVVYKGQEENEETGEMEDTEKTIVKTVNSDGTDDYVMDNNWLLKNLVWEDSEINSLADAMVTKMKNATWFPFEMWCAGLPYIEAGDQVEIHMRGSSNVYRSYVLRHSLKGIQNLQDEMINGTLDIF